MYKHTDACASFENQPIRLYGRTDAMLEINDETIRDRLIATDAIQDLARGFVIVARP
jgi:hypothetical protein